jgi:hypothetical protein
MIDQTAGYDAGVRSRASERQERRRGQNERHDADLVWLMNHHEGRRFIGRLLQNCHLNETSFTGTSATFFCEGERKVGLQVLADIVRLCPDLHARMAGETAAPGAGSHPQEENWSMTESLIAPIPDTQGAGSDRAPSSVATADLVYRGPEAEAVETAKPEAPPHADGRSPPLLEPHRSRAEALRPSGVKWVNAFNGFVPPFLTLCFFAFYAAVKAAQFVILQQDHGGSAATLLSMWGEEDWAVWAAVVTFWFGGRHFNKERGRG